MIGNIFPLYFASLAERETSIFLPISNTILLLQLCLDQRY